MPDRRPAGPGRVLTLAYGFFALAAGARSTVQLLGHPHRALTAYVLSAVAAAIYLTGTVLVLQAERGRLRRAAVACCLVEVAGVLGVGLLSLASPELFPKASVWSRFGSGYGYVPALLPVVALVWLHAARRSARSAPDGRDPQPQYQVGRPSLCPGTAGPDPGSKEARRPWPSSSAPCAVRPTSSTPSSAPTAAPSWPGTRPRPRSRP